MQQDIGLSRGPPEAEAWQACGPLEEAIAALCSGSLLEAVTVSVQKLRATFGLLAKVVEDHMQQAHVWQKSLQAAEVGCHTHASKSGFAMLVGPSQCEASFAYGSGGGCSAPCPWR